MKLQHYVHWKIGLCSPVVRKLKTKMNTVKDVTIRSMGFVLSLPWIDRGNSKEYNAHSIFLRLALLENAHSQVNGTYLGTPGSSHTT